MHDECTPTTHSPRPSNWDYAADTDASYFPEYFFEDNSKTLNSATMDFDLQKNPYTLTALVHPVMDMTQKFQAADNHGWMA